MNRAFMIFLLVWFLTQTLSLLMLRLGGLWGERRWLVWLGEVAHRQKMVALDRVWPLTRLRSAVARGSRAEAALILTSLITLKSGACLVTGVVVVFWLPLASLVVPSVVAVHDPNDAVLARWVQRVAALQVTSHAVAAALGFTLTLAGPLSGGALSPVIAENAPIIWVGLAVSFLFAILAGRAEAAGVLRRGVEGL